MYPSKRIEELNDALQSDSIIRINLIPKNVTLETVYIRGESSRTHAIGAIDIDPDKLLTTSVGNFRDISRILSRFPSVANPDDTQNAMIVRGNSPVRLLWKLEGIEITNPNHLATLGNTEGGVNILNPYTLSHSSFYAGAFPAEYGNAVSAVFDVSLRNGNQDTNKYFFRTSIVDIEAAIEGPLFRKKKSSFLVAYRRANLRLLSNLRKQLEETVGNSPLVNDLTFKLHFPMKKGFFNIFGVGGISDLNLPVPASEFNEINQYSSKSYALGFKTNLHFSNIWSINISSAISGLQTKNSIEFSPADLDTTLNNGINSYEEKVSFSTSIIGAISNRFSIKFGIDIHSIFSDIVRDYRRTANDLKRLYVFDNRYERGNLYFHAKWKLLADLEMNTGVHASPRYLEEYCF